MSRLLIARFGLLSALTVCLVGVSPVHARLIERNADTPQTSGLCRVTSDGQLDCDPPPENDGGGTTALSTDPQELESFGPTVQVQDIAPLILRLDNDEFDVLVDRIVELRNAQEGDGQGEVM